MKQVFTLIIFALITIKTSVAINIIYGPYLQLVGENEATIVWVTDRKALSWVEIAPDDSLNFYAEARPKYFETYLGRKVLGTVHKVRVKSLHKGTTYRYRIFSQEVLDEQDYKIIYGQVAASDVYRREPLRFTTRDAGKTTVNFCVINDMHADTAKMEHLLSNVRNEKNDFVIFNGDMVSSMNSEKQIFDGFVNTATGIFASELPFYMSRGNHESRGTFAKRFLDYFPTPTGLPYYSFREGPVFFIVLDGGEDKPDNDIEYHGTAAFDDYRQQQAEWLKGVVAGDDFKSAPFKVVITHVPPVNDTWHGPLHANKLFLPILNGAGIDLMICAHLHRYVYSPANTVGAAFPILINSNKDIVKVRANASEMTLSIWDETGKELKRFSYKSNPPSF